MKCDHDPAGECWLCGDALPWWREARIKKGLPADPPNKAGRLLRNMRRRMAS